MDAHPLDTPATYRALAFTAGREGLQAMHACDDAGTILARADLFASAGHRVEVQAWSGTAWESILEIDGGR